MTMYSKSNYWDDRYLKNYMKPFDWYMGYRDLRRLLNPLYFATQSRGATIKPQKKPLVPCKEDLQSFPSRDKCRVLILGCGNSTFGEEMLMDGWTGGIVNVDFSQVVISQMKAKYNGKFYQRVPTRRHQRGNFHRMEFHCMDVTEGLPFADDSFDLIVCKGTFDAILCGAGSVTNIRQVVKECVRILSPGHGILFLVTHANPDNRIVFLEHDNRINYYWEGVSVHPVAKYANSRQETYQRPGAYAYICRKRLVVGAPDCQGKENALHGENRVTECS